MRKGATAMGDLDGSGPFVTSSAMLGVLSPLFCIITLFIALQDICNWVFQNHTHRARDGLASFACQVEGMDTWILFKRIGGST